MNEASAPMPVESYEQTGRRTKELTRAQIRKARISGIVMLALSAVTMFLLVPATSGLGAATFGLSTPDDVIQLAPLSVPSTGALWVLSAVLAFLGATQFVRGFQKRTTIILGIAFAVFVLAIMVWATAGQEFSFISMLVATVARCTPIALGALSGILCERSGVVNIGIEGMLLGGAFTGVVIGSLWGGVAGLIASTLIGGLLALLLAVLAVNFKVDQIIIGVVINILVLGLTSFLTAQVLVKKPELNDAPIFPAVKIPVLGDIPIIGPMFFDQTILVYGMYILIGVVTFFLFRTRWGLRTRSVGENPKAADSLGVSVAKVRYLAVVYGGMVGGFAGAWFTLGTVGRFDEGMTGGRGFIGLAAMIFGAWNPIGAFMAALIFGFFDSLQQKFAVLDTPIPSEFLAMAPYLVTIIVVAGRRPAVHQGVAIAAVDWDALVSSAIEIMHRAYAPYSRFKVGVAGLMDDGRTVVGCNVENASYGLGLCAECGMVSNIHATGGGHLVAIACVDQHGAALMPCGRCRQLLWEHGRPDTLIRTPEGILTLRDILPQAFGPQDLIDRAEDRTFHADA